MALLELFAKTSRTRIVATYLGRREAFFICRGRGLHRRDVVLVHGVITHFAGFEFVGAAVPLYGG